MIKETNVEWTRWTWNPWQGCVKKTIKINSQVKLREECRNCYMYRDKKRYGQKPQIVVRSEDPTFYKPLKLQKDLEKEIQAGKEISVQDRIVFTCSWSDWNNPEADEWRTEAWEVIRRCPDLIFQILTKLPERMPDYLPGFWDEIKDRCWVGVSCGYQEAADQMIPALLKIPVAVRFLSCEPLLSRVNLNPYFWHDGVGFRLENSVDWVIIGGESGPGSRPMHPDWARQIRDDCFNAKVPFFLKQWGEFVPVAGPDDNPNRQTLVCAKCGKSGDYPLCNCQPYEAYHQRMERVGKKVAGRLLDGQEWGQFPK